MPSATAPPRACSPRAKLPPLIKDGGRIVNISSGLTRIIGSSGSFVIMAQWVQRANNGPSQSHNERLLMTDDSPFAQSTISLAHADSSGWALRRREQKVQSTET